MSLVLYKQPNTLDLVHNHLFFQIKGVPPDYQPGAKVWWKIETTHGLPSDGDEIHLPFLGQVHKFIFSDVFPMPSLPDGFNCALPTTSHRDICTALGNYLPFKQYYTITYDGVQFVIEALLLGADYNISDSVFPDEYDNRDYWPGLNKVIPTNYHFLAQLSANKLSAVGTFISLPEFRIDPDDDLLSHIEVGDLLRSRFRNYFELPDFDLSAPSKALIPVISYYLIFKEMSGDNMLSTLTTTTYKVINGKVNRADHPRFNLRTWIASEKKFLTNMPKQVYTWFEAKHFLYYLSPFATDTSVRVKLEINSKEGNAPEEHMSEVTTLKQDEILIIPVTGMLASLTNMAKLHYVSVSLINDADVTIANAVTFFYLPKTMHNRAFLFQNRLGGFDTLITRAQKNTFKVKKKEQRRIMTPDYSPYLGDLSSDDPEMQDTFTAETIPVSGAMVQHYKEMAASRVAFMQSDDRWVRVWIEPGSFKAEDENKDLNIFKFTYKPMFDGDILSTKLSLPEPAHEDYSLEYLKTDYI